MSSVAERKDTGGKGRLTDSLIDKFVYYYGNAIRCNSTSAKEMRKVIWPLWGHSCSTDAEPMHWFCPTDPNTWSTRGLLETEHVILNHGQVTWTTPELAPPLLTTTPNQWEDVSALDRFNGHRCPTRRVFCGTGLELETKQATVRYLYHSATAASSMWWTHSKYLSVKSCIIK
ncbi:uncharacterized protein TNCV_746351 [Trichonephila clavipes]|nr:uncharacterized protein TNCV_746351 [Trichonephila clavipes]